VFLSKIQRGCLQTSLELFSYKIFIQVRQVCIKYGVNKSQKDAIPREARDLDLEVEEWAFLRRINWAYMYWSPQHDMTWCKVREALLRRICTCHCKDIQYQKCETNIPRKGIAPPQSQFLYIYVSVSDLYIYKAGLPILLQENSWTECGNI